MNWTTIKRSTAEPIFILAAGWRSGSTLLQRMCMEDYFIWGEPYGPGGMIQNMAESFAATVSLQTANEFFYDGYSKCSDLTEKFVANLTPSIQKLVDAHIAWFEAMFVRQEKWGIKEVRLDSSHAAYLRILFPKAKIVFLFRNPYNCYRSIAPWFAEGNKLFISPTKEITIQNFGKHWFDLTTGFLRDAEQLDAYCISYEYLCQGKIEGLERYLFYRLSKKALACNPEDGFGEPCKDIDVTLIHSQVSPLAPYLGYQP